MRRAARGADNIAAAPLAGAGDERHVTVECVVCTNAHFIDHALLALLRLFGRAEPPPQDPHCPAASPLGAWAARGGMAPEPAPVLN